MMLAAVLCAIGGAVIGGAIGFCFSESLMAPALEGALADLKREREDHATTRADRERWKGLANKLHDETETQRAFLEPIFRVRGN